jgi:hypothetical protein
MTEGLMMKGELSSELLEIMLDTIPIQWTVLDANDKVRACRSFALIDHK